VSGLWKVVSDGNPDPSNTLINGNAVFTLESSGNTSVPGSMIPTVANSYDLGSVDSPWRSLYVSNSTIYIDSVPLSVSGNTLTVAGIPVITSDTTDPVITSNTVTSAGLVLTTNTGIQFSDNTVLTSTDSIGTVKSVDISGGNTGLTTADGPITSTGTITLEGTLNIEHGGTGANSIAAGYVISNGTVLSSTLTIAGEDITGDIGGNSNNVTGVVDIANGGTGATTAEAAFTALAPSQASNAGKLLSTDGTTASWTSLGITNEIYVSKGGNDSTADGSITKPFLTISAAINYLNTNYPVANNSGTQFVIVVGPGLYTESVNINRLLTHLWAYEGKLKTTRISGTVTITSAVDYQGIFQNVVSLNNLFIDNTTNNAVEVTGSIPISIDINDCVLYTDSTGVPFVMTNTALGGNRLRLIDTVLTAAGNASALDITNVTNCFINDINTSSAKSGGSAWKIADSVMTIGTVQLVGSGTNGPTNLLEVTGATSIVSVGYSSFTSSTTNGNGIYIGAGARVIAGANFYNIPLGTGYSVTGAAGGIYVRGGNQAVPGTNNTVNPLLSLSTFNMNTHVAGSDIVGAIAIANGGTGQTNKTAAFDALAPTTTAGDLIYYNGTDNVRLPVGSNNQVLTVNNGIPSWTNNSSNTNYGNSNVISLLSSFGDNNISTTGNISAGNMYSSGALQGSIIVSVNSSGNEGGEIQLAKAPNSTLSGNNVIIDQYIDRIRFFEEGGTTKGAYIDLSQAAEGVGTLLNNRVSGLVNAGTFITMDNLKATVTTSGQRGLSLATVSGSNSYFIGGTYATDASGGYSGSLSVTTTPSSSVFNWNFTGAGNISTYILTDATNSRAYRITLQIGSAYNNNMISIERLV
jgi:hypothetical protein